MGLKFATEVQHYVRTLAPSVRKEIRAALRKLSSDPRHPELDLKALHKDGPYTFFRARIRDYRIIYTPKGHDCYVWRIQHRADGYEWLDRLDPGPGPATP